LLRVFCWWEKWPERYRANLDKRDKLRKENKDKKTLVIAHVLVLAVIGILAPIITAIIMWFIGAESPIWVRIIHVYLAILIYIGMGIGIIIALKILRTLWKWYIGIVEDVYLKIKR